MAYGIINLSEIFSPGTIGHDREYNPLSAQNPGLLSLFLQEDSDCEPLSIKKLERIERAILDIFNSETEDSNPDEILRQSGFYDSTDKRYCINRKRR